MRASLRSRVSIPLEAVGTVVSNPGLLRLELGSLASGAADGLYVVGLAVLAYKAGGTAAVALVAILRALPSVVLVPVLLSLTDGRDGDRTLRLTMWARVISLAAATGFVIGGAPPAMVYVLAGVDAVAGGLLRPLRGTLTPALARSTEELVAANVAATTGDALAAILGPGGAALILAVGDVPATFVAATVVIVLALLAVLPIHASMATIPAANGDRDDTAHAGRHSVLGSVRDLLAMRYARTILLLFAGQRFVRGVITVALVAAAFDLLGIGDSGVGVLTGAIGLGGLFGGTVALGLVGRARLAPAFAAGLLAWGAGILAAGVVPNVLFVVAALAIAGVGKTTLDTAGFTLLQRTVPNERRSSVFGLLEAVMAAGLAVGPIAATLLVDRLGAAWALVVAGALPLALVAIAWPVLRVTDDAAIVPQPALRLLSGVAMFRPLQLTTLEALAGHMVQREASAGSDVIRQGESGDTFYIVESGRLEALVDGSPIGVLGPGDSFGEIALLRETERTATVRAIKDSRLVELARGPFLAAVTSRGESLAAANAVIDTRLASG